MPFGITATLGLDGRGFKAGMREAQGITNKWAGGLKGQIASAFTAAALVRATQDVVKYASKVDDLSKKLSISRRAVQEFDYAAKLSSATIEDVAAAFKGLSQSRGEALSNPGSADASIFKALGISPEQLRNNPLEETMKAINRSFQTMDFGGSEEDMITRLLGKGGVALLPMMKDGFDKAAASLQAMGGIIKDDVIKNLDATGDKIDGLATKMRADLSDAAAQFAGWLEKAWTWASKISEASFDKIFAEQIAGDTGGNSREIMEVMKVMAWIEKNEAKQKAAAAAAKADAPRAAQDPWIPPTDAKKEAAVAAFRGSSPSSDSLSRIGGFVGGGGGTANRLSSIDQELKKLNAQVRAGIIIKE